MSNATMLIITHEETPYQFRTDGWFNATAAAKKFDKLPSQWLRLPSTESYIAALVKRNETNCVKITQSSKINDLREAFIQTQTGDPETGGGTWLHPKLAVPFARWLSDDFAVWCDEQIEHIIKEQGRWSETAKLDWITQRLNGKPSHIALQQAAYKLTAINGDDMLAGMFTNFVHNVLGIVNGTRDQQDANMLRVLAAMETKVAHTIERLLKENPEHNHTLVRWIERQIEALVIAEAKSYGYKPLPQLLFRD